jgi:hypothetical protein
MNLVGLEMELLPFDLFGISTDRVSHMIYTTKSKQRIGGESTELLG